MKVNGKKLNGPRIVDLPMPYVNDDGEEDFILFRFRALTSKDDFEKVMPRPKPPVIKKPGGEEYNNYEDKNFITRIEKWMEYKINWEFLQSIKATEDLTWETITDDPETWKEWRTEIDKNFGLVAANRIFKAYLDANSLDEEAMDNARKRFLASRAKDQLGK